MKLIIDIPEEQFTTLNAKTQAEVKTVIDYELLVKAIKNGIPYEQRPQGDLISRDALKKACSEMIRGSNNSDFIPCPSWNNAMDLIDNAPTVEEKSYAMGFQDGLEDGLQDIRPQGEWIRKGDSKWHCSKCGAVPEFDGTTNTDKFNVTMSNKYCRLCGADMRKGGAK